MKYFTVDEHKNFIRNIERDLRKYYSECYCTHYWNPEVIPVLDVFLTYVKGDKDVIKTSITQHFMDRDFIVSNVCKELNIDDKRNFETYEECITYILNFLKGAEFLLVNEEK